MNLIASLEIFILISCVELKSLHDEPVMELRLLKNEDVSIWNFEWSKLNTQKTKEYFQKLSSVMEHLFEKVEAIVIQAEQNLQIKEKMSSLKESFAASLEQSKENLMSYNWQPESNGTVEIMQKFQADLLQILSASAKFLNENKLDNVTFRDHFIRHVWIRLDT